MLEQLLALTLALLSVFVKGFQHKNIQGNHYRLIFVTSYIMAITDVLMISLVVQKGWTICFATGSGAAIGMLLSLWVHSKVVSKTPSQNQDQDQNQTNSTEVT